MEIVLSTLIRWGLALFALIAAFAPTWWRRTQSVKDAGPMRDDRSTKRVLIPIDIAIILMLLLLSISVTSSLYRYSNDDAYITFRYAKNLAAGQGFVYNVGQRYLATTSPLLTLLLAGMSRAFPEVPIPSLGGLVSGFSLCLLTVSLFLAGRKLSQRFVGTFGAMLLASNPLLASTFGGEALLFLALGSLSFCLYLHDREYPAVVSLGLCTLTRPDGAILATLILGHMVWTKRRSAIGPVLTYLLSLAPWLIFAYSYFGAFLPTTLSAKVAQGQSGLWESFVKGAIKWLLREIAGIRAERKMLHISSAGGVLYVPMLVVGLYKVITNPNKWWLLLAWALLEGAAYVILRMPYYHWYLAPIILAIFLFVASGAGAILDGVQSQWRAPGPSLASPIATHGRKLCSVILVLILVVAGLATFDQTLQLTGLIGKLPHRQQPLYTQVANWLHENTPEQASVAYLEIGYIGFHSDRPIVDLVGLVTPEVSAHIRQKDFRWAIHQFCPDYFIYNELFEGWLGLQSEPRFWEVYEPRVTFSYPRYPKPLTIYQRQPNTCF